MGTAGTDLTTLLPFTFAGTDVANITSWLALDIEPSVTATA